MNQKPIHVSKKQRWRISPDGRKVLVAEVCIDTFLNDSGCADTIEREEYARTRCGCTPFNIGFCYLCHEISCDRHLKNCAVCGHVACVACAEVKMENGAVRELTCRKCVKPKRKTSNTQKYLPMYLRLICP